MQSYRSGLADSLRAKVTQITDRIPEAEAVFQEVFDAGRKSSEKTGDGPDQKRRRTESADNVSLNKEDVIFELQDVSVLSPLRKKLTMTIALEPESQAPMITFNKNNAVEYVIKDIRNSVTFASFLPFPEKKNLMYLYINYSVDGNPADPVLITLNKDHLLKQFKERNIISESENDFQSCIDYMRRQAILTGFRISDPFSKTAMEAHHSFSVDCYRGSKEGTVFFLPEHIIFGFKKPILQFDSRDIDAITYSSITRLTFNVTLITKQGDKFEFSMIDQNKFSEIDEYVKRKEVEDKSMSNELKAKTPKTGQTTEQSALKEALQESKTLGSADSDDEDDENFEEESELSDGSGSSDEEDDADDQEDEEAASDQNSNEGAEEEEEEEEEQEVEKEEAAGTEGDQNVSSETGTTPSNQFTMEIDEIPDLLNENGLIQDISIGMDEEDDGEGSGVEYD